MLSKHILAPSLVAAAGLLCALDASANSRFTLDNKTKKKLTVLIYNGDDSICTTAAKSKYVRAGNSNSYGCEGHSEHRCKVRVYQGQSKACKSLANTCSNSAIKVPDGSKITVEPVEDDEYDCTVD